ncbi:MAG: DUF2141 domain-containing protein [Bacteroides sp.]|nr:DUF2141 domain-containing protein [Bacteroides sp.]
MKRKFLMLACLLQLGCGMLWAQNLTIEVRGIEQVEGKLMVAIFSSAENFLKKPVAAFAVEVKEKTLSIPCKGLPAGTYAISLFQDVNGNSVLDTGTYGIPTEKYGFSNDAEVVMGPPTYEKACFSFSADKTVVIHLR